MGGFRNQWIGAGGPDGQGIRRFWGPKPGGVAPDCVVDYSGSYKCAAPSTIDCDMNDQTATNLGRFAFHFKEDDTAYIGWNAANSNAGHLVPQDASFSISCWVTLDAKSWRNRIYVWDGINASGQVDNFYFGRKSNKVTWYKSTIGETAQEFKGSTSFSSYNTWYHIGCTYDHSTKAVILYLNGASDGTGTETSGISTETYGTQAAISAPDPVYITGQPLYGNIDDIGVWDKVLSAANMASLYNSGNGAKCNTVESANLVRYVDFEVGPGNEPKDTIAGGLGDGVWVDGACVRRQTHSLVGLARPHQVVAYI